MKKIRLFFKIVIILLITCYAFYATLDVFASEINEENISIIDINNDFADDRVLVVMNDSYGNGASFYSMNPFDAYRCSNVKDLTIYPGENDVKPLDESSRLNINKVFCLELENSTKEYVLEVIESLNERDDVLYAGPDYKISLEMATNDTSAAHQWAIEKLQLSNAWEMTTGNLEILVGVIDSGIDGTHPDLADSIVNELCRDFSTGEEIEVSVPTDMHGHGTHVAGIIGAIGDNQLGVAGTCWNVGLVSLRIFDSEGDGFSSYCAEAIKYANQKGINVLNLSAGWRTSNDRYDLALDTVISQYEGLIFCAAGNKSEDNDGINPIYPASYDLGNIVSVGAINKYDGHCSFSNYGEESVDIYAPGYDIISTYPTSMCINGTHDDETRHASNGYHWINGTSMATPYENGM